MHIGNQVFYKTAFVIVQHLACHQGTDDFFKDIKYLLLILSLIKFKVF